MSLGAGYRHGTVSNGFDGRLNGREMGRQSGEWFLRLSLNAYKPPASLPKLGRYTATHSTNGQAVITLTHDDNADKSAYEQMFFDVNGRLTPASTLSQDNNKSTYLLDLPKGVHKIGLDGRDLPIQYALPAQAVAKIAPRLPTHINWHISQTYGIRGRLSLGRGRWCFGKMSKKLPPPKAIQTAIFSLINYQQALILCRRVVISQSRWWYRTIMWWAWC